MKVRITLNAKDGIGEARLRALLRILIDGAQLRVESAEALPAKGKPRRLPASTWRAYTAAELMALWPPELLLPGFHGVDAGDGPQTMDDLAATMAGMDAAFGHLFPAARRPQRRSLEDVVLEAVKAAAGQPGQRAKAGARKGGAKVRS
jgi:hypothetical protein